MTYGPSLSRARGRLRQHGREPRRAYHRMPEFQIVASSLAARLRGAPSARSWAGCLSSATTARRSGPTGRTSRASTTTPRRTARSPGRRSRAGCHVFLREAARHDRGRGQASSTRRRSGSQAGCRYILRVPPAWTRFIEIARYSRQAARHADEPEPAEPRARLELAPQADGLDEPHRGLRRPLRGRHVAR